MSTRLQQNDRLLPWACLGISHAAYGMVSFHARELDTFADFPTLLHINVQVLKIGQLEFNDLWHEGASSFVRMVTKPEFGSWVSYMGLILQS